MSKGYVFLLCYRSWSFSHSVVSYRALFFRSRVAVCFTEAGCSVHRDGLFLNLCGFVSPCSGVLLFQMYITSTIKTKSSRLAKPVLCLGTLCTAFLTGLNRVSEYRNHCSDVIAGFVLGSSIALFLVRTNIYFSLPGEDYQTLGDKFTFRQDNNLKHNDKYTLSVPDIRNTFLILSCTPLLPSEQPQFVREWTLHGI